MSTIREAAALRNGQSIAIAAIPHLEMTAFQDAILVAIGQGERVASLFAQRIASGDARLYVVLAQDTKQTFAVLSTTVGLSYPSLTQRCPQVHLFEREVYEQLGVRPEGHPWLKPVRRHDFAATDNSYPFFSMAGEEVHEVAVGPVHAGVIEPGHFRFQCTGEVVHHLEIHFGYQHRGVEEALAGGPHRRTMAQMETIAGDTTIGHASAYVQALEALGGVEAPPRAQALRAIALELERLANHVGDMGALSGDVGFLPTASFCGRLRGDFLNMTAVICGNRFGRGLVRPGGVAFDVDAKMIEDLLARLEKAERDVTSAIDLFFGTDSVVGRLDGTGRVDAKTLRDLGIVGVAARAGGLEMDARPDHPFGWYRTMPMLVATGPSGDVQSRAIVRRKEIENSISYVRAALQRLPAGAISVPCPPSAPDRFVVSATEGWRGEVVHAVVTDERGRFARYKVTDPSFHNWMALAMALRGQQISDFPLCNKSFNLSYCGFDL